MNKKQMHEIVKAIMMTSGLMPQIEDDYYENLNGTSVGLFCNGMCSYFDMRMDHWMFHFNNLEYLDTPAETFAFFQEHMDDIINGEP